jgi:glycosidase
MAAIDGQGFWFSHTGENSITTFAYQVKQSPVKNPSWMQDAVIYQIFLDRFHPGNEDGSFDRNTGPGDFHGGTLKGVVESLPFLADLGINCLWLSPIGVADTYHRYDSKDYFAIDPKLGTDADMRELIDQAHEAGMRVLLDFVPCHCSWKHPAFLAAQKSKDAESYSWFTFYEWPDKYRTFLDMSELLPSFDTNDPGARKYIIDSALYWMHEFGVDGYRLDHVIGGGMDFWLEFKMALEAENPEVVTIGEATDTPDSLRRFRGHLHDILDFPLARALRHTFATRDWSIQEFDTFLETYDAYMQTGPGRVSFLDNHDMERFLFVANGKTENLKIAALCQFSLQVTPTVYYGTEIGLSHEQSFAEVGFGGDAEARKDMPWDPEDWDHDLLNFYKRLIEKRKTYPALQTGSRKTIHLDDHVTTYAFRLSFDNAQDVIAAFNLGDSTQTLSLSESDLSILLATNPGIQIEGKNLHLPPNSGAWVTIS